MIARLEELLFIIVPCGWVLCGLGVLFIVWALMWDWLRRRTRRETHPRCPKCWYNMTGATSLTCPECGRTAKSQKRLQKRDGLRSDAPKAS